MRRLLILAVLLPGPACSVAFGHGTAATVRWDAPAVQAVYDDGRPMAFCEAQVFRPAEADAPYWVGETDEHGWIAFVPGGTGMWHVAVDDGMGHVARVDVPVASDAMAPASAGVPATGGVGRWSGVVAGVGVILGLFGLASLLGRRQRQ